MISSAAEFVVLREKNDERAAKDTAPEGVWLEIVRTRPDMKEWVVQNKTVPTSILNLLADDPDSNIRFCVAMKRKCPPAVLEKLARDPDEQVRLRVAANAKTPASLLRLLAKDPDKDVAAAAADQLLATT